MANKPEARTSIVRAYVRACASGLVFVYDEYIYALYTERDRVIHRDR